MYDIIVYGEFDFIVRSLSYVAGIFSPATGYIGLIGAIGVAAMVFGIVSVLAGQVTSGKGSMISWAMNMLLATVIITSCTGMKSQVIVHDKTLNKVATIGEVPELMIYVAYIQNYISNTMKDTITTIMAPIVSYDLIGKGQGFELLASVSNVGKDFFNRNPQTLESLGNYMQHCVAPDMTYGWIDAKAYNYPADSNMWAALKSETMTRFSPVVTIDTAGKRSSVALPCAQAYREIDKQLSSMEMQNTLKNQCAQNVGDGLNEQTACESILTGLFGEMVAPGVAKNVVIRNYLISWAFMSKHGALASTLNDMNKRNASGAFTAEKVLPKLKGMMFGLIIGVFPLVLAFVWFRPGKTIIFYGSLFILMILWDAIDTFMDMQYQNEVFNMYATMRKNGLGLQQMFDIPNIAADAVSLYGQGRWMTLGLASAITASITGVSVHALSSMGSQVAATAQGAAASGAQYMDTAGQARLSEKANIDAGARAALSQTTVANWSGVANYETQRMLSDMKTGTAMSNALGNAGTASYRADNAVDSLTGSHGGFSGDKAMAQAAGFSNLEQYRDWSNKGKIIDQNVANSLTANGVPASVAQNSIGLSMTSAGLGENGNITNFGAKGIDASGKDRSVSLAENVARFQVQNGSQNIAGFDIGNGGNVTAKYNPDGSVAQLGVEGAGYTRFSHNPATGATSGTHAFEKNGIEYTNRYQGNDLTTSFMDKTGDSITRHSMRDGNGQYNAYKTDITVGHNGYNIDGVQFQPGSTISQGGDGMSQISGVINHNGESFKVSATTDASGSIASITGDSGEVFNKNDIHNTTTENLDRSRVGRTSEILNVDSYRTGKEMTAQTALSQALNATTGSGTINTDLYNAYTNGKETGNMAAYNNLRNEYADKLANAVWNENIEQESFATSTNANVSAQGSVGVQASAGLDSKDQVFGKVANILTGASASVEGTVGASLSGSVGMGTSSSDTTLRSSESMKIDFSNSIDNMMNKGGDDKDLASMMKAMANENMTNDNRGILTSKQEINEKTIDKYFDAKSKGVK